jgi:CHAT domain-containing protein
MLNRRNENLAVNKPKHIPAIVAAGIIGLALSALWFNQSGRVQAQSSDTPLMFSTIIERNLDSDQPHRYTVNLSAGQALSIATTQKRKANLILSALDSSGKTLTEVNCLDGSDETETMTFVAESNGQYFITIRLTKNSTQSGGYGLLAQPPHFASQTDHDRVAAQNDYQSGRELRNLRTGDARRKAVPLAENALRVWQAQGDRQWESVTLHLLGMLNYELGQTDLAMEYFNRALPIKQQLGIRNSEFSTLTFICTAFGDLGRNREALACRKQALPISRELGDEESALLLQSDIGLAHMLLGEKEPAQQNFNQALADSRATGNALSESLALQNLGTLFMDFGEYQQSLDYYEQAEIIRRKLGDKRRLGVTLSNLGTLHTRLGDEEKASSYFQQAHDLYLETGNQNDISNSLVNLARLEVIRGNYQKALESLFESLTISERTKNSRGQYLALNTIGSVQTLTGELLKAEENFKKSLAISLELSDPELQTITLQRLGRIELRKNRPAEARPYFDQSLQLVRKTRDVRKETDALLGLAETELAEDRLTEALNNSSRAIELIESLRSKILKTDLRSSFFAGQQSPYQTHIEILMRLHQRQPAAGYATQALTFSERARARNLLDTLTEASTDLRAGLSPELLTQEKNLRFQINKREQARLAALPGKVAASQSELSDKEMTQLLSDYESLRAKIRQASPRYSALTQPQPLTAEQIQKLLDEDSVLLEYALGQKQSVLWAVTTDSVNSFLLPEKSRIEEAANRCYNLLKISHQRRWKHSASLSVQELSQLILPSSPEFQNLLKRKRLVVVADGALQFIPFGLLKRLPGKAAAKTSQLSNQLLSGTLLANQLLADMESVNLPSASALAALREELKGRQKPSKQLAIFFDPVFQQNDPRVKAVTVQASIPDSAQSVFSLGHALAHQLTRSAEDIGLNGFVRLPYSRREAEAILSLAGDATSLKAFDFGASRVTALNSQLGDYRIIHFATHGLLNPRHPELSGLALSLVNEKGQPQDGFLRMTDLYDLKLNADLIVLSACRTAMGKDVKGEGLIGLTRGFMYAGAPRIVASLWDVNDAATAELMSRFYRHLLKDKLPATAALRAAQLSMSKESRWAAPYYWAGFVIQGDWQIN